MAQRLTRACACVFRRYEKELDEQRIPGEQRLPFVHGAQLVPHHDRPAAALYLEALAHVNPSRARQAFNVWSDAHGDSAEFASLYTVMLQHVFAAQPASAPYDVEAAIALLERLHRQHISVSFNIIVIEQPVLALLRTRDVTRASWLYQHFRPTRVYPQPLLALLHAFLQHGALGMCADLLADSGRLTKSTLNVPGSTWKQLRELTNICRKSDGPTVKQGR